MTMFTIPRKVIFAFCLVGLIYSGPVQAQGLTDPPEGGTSQFLTWSYQGSNMGFYLPTSSAQHLPIVMYLHYCTGSPVYESFWIIPALNAIEPTAVFLPTAPVGGSCADWGGTYDQSLRPSMINALHELDSLIKVYDLDSSRVYLYGESMGGEGVYRLLMDFPNRFAAGIVASGYTENKGAQQMASTPLWIFHGSQDGLSGVSNARTIYQSILDAGGTLVHYTEYEGLDHVPAMNAPHSEEGLLDWFLSQERSTSHTKYGTLRMSQSSADLVRYQDGHLQLSSSISLGSVFSVYNASGDPLYKGLVTNHSVKVPSLSGNQILYWQLREGSESTSGTIRIREK